MPEAPKPEVLSSSSYPAKIKFIIAPIIIVFILLLTAGIYFYIQKPANPIPQNKYINQLTKSGADSYASPLKIDKNALRSFGFTYIVTARIRDVDTSKNPALVTTSITDSSFPRIEVATGTAIYVRKSGKETRVKINALTQGSLVDISLFYDLMKSRWTVPKIVKIIKNATPSATPKSSLNPNK